MPTLETFLQVAAGAGGTGVVLGLWLYVTWRDLRDVRAELKAERAKVEARDALRLQDHQGALREAAAALRGDDIDEEPLPRTPTGRHRTTR